MEPWQFFSLVRKVLPAGMLQSIFSRSTRLVQLWSANPAYCEHTARTPLERLRLLLKHLYLAGYGEYSRWAIDYLAEPLGGCFAYRESSRSDKGSVDGEAVDAFTALGRLVDEIRASLEDGRLEPEEKDRIRERCRRVIRELEELMDAAGMEDVHDGAA